MLTDDEIYTLAKRALERRRKWRPSTWAFEDALISQATTTLAESCTDIVLTLERDPTKSYVQIAREIGNVSARGLERVTFQAFAARGLVKEFAADSLVRYIHYKSPNGWPSLPQRDLNLKFSGWVSNIVDMTMDETRIVAAAKTVRDLVFIAPPESGWLPNGVSDPIISQVIDKFWT
ncbi:MAG: hypothetical protein JNM43_07745 [Planctomycetaceae bacterium]|nr:hypothetical protein [Planctomycetaceae bacterium]